MNLAETYLRQARSFARAGDSQRAVELFERARALAGNDHTMMRRILEELMSAYAIVGQQERAARCREELAALPAEHAEKDEAAADAPFAPPGASGASSSLPANRRARRAWVQWAAAFFAGITVAAAIVTSVWLRRLRPANTAQAPAAGTLAPAQAPEVAAPVVGAGGSVLLSGTTTPVPSMQNEPGGRRLFELPAPQPATGPMAGSIDQRLKGNVALLVVMIHYEGTVTGRRVSVDWPVGNGTAFAVAPEGLMMTNRHVVEGGRKADMPATLESFGMPTVTRRRTDLVVCFGPDERDHHKGTVAYESDRFDMALIRVDRRFAAPLILTTSPCHQGDDLYVCGYPGAVIESLNATAQSASHRQEFIEKLRATSTFDLLLYGFSPESFKSTLTRGVVSQQERNFEGSAYLQTDAAVTAGNSGGPAMNAKHEVLGIVTLQTATSDKYNYALLLEQPADELEPYLKIH